MHFSLASSTTTNRACDSKSRRRAAAGGGQACFTRMSPLPQTTATIAAAAAAANSDASTPSPAAAGSARLNGGASASTSGRISNGNQLRGRDAMTPLYASMMMNAASSKSAVAAAASPSSSPAPATAATAAAASALGLVDESGTLSLANVRASLIRQEDTIIFSLIERAQFARNGNVYERGLLPGLPLMPRAAAENVGQGGGSSSSTAAAAAAAATNEDDLIAPSLLEHMLRETEAVHGRVRRYTSPDEHAFYPSLLPAPLLPPLAFASSPLAACADGINLNGQVLEAYLSRALPLLTREGDDGNYGSAALGDVAALQALSKRVHYGKFVAEAKYRASPGEYRALAAARDEEGIMRLLTDEAVEDAVVARVRAKAAAFGREVRDSSGGGGGGSGGGSNTASASAKDEEAEEDTPLKVDPDAVAAFYRGFVLPLTKDVQVRYLLERPNCD